MTQIAPTEYRRPSALPPGAVLVVGSGETGCQIAEELRRAGRRVYLSVGRSWWVPRRYRGRDTMSWIDDLGILSQIVMPGARSGGISAPQVTGSDGGRDLNVHTLAREGVVLVGRLRDVHDGKAIFASDLAENLARGDDQSFALLRSIDDHIAQHGVDAPAAGRPGYRCNVDELVQRSPMELDFATTGISVVVWATGYRPDFAWVRLPVMDADGYPVHLRGVTAVPGLYFVGLCGQHRVRSCHFNGVGDDAAYLASAIASQRTMLQCAA